MRSLLLAADLSLAALASGTFTNEEQVYFWNDAHKPAPAWTGIRLTAQGKMHSLQKVDAFGTAQAAPAEIEVDGTSLRVGGCVQKMRQDGDGYIVDGKSCPTEIGAITAIAKSGIRARSETGDEFDLRRATGFSCWVSIRKAQPKPDGGEDWSFQRDLRLHDAGGRVAASTDEATPTALVLRMRNVTWTQGPNRPSLVLYVHAPNDPARAISYVWADPGAIRVGVNLRWMQASCTRD